MSSTEKNKALIKKIKELKKEVQELKIELKKPTCNTNKSERLEVGEEVDILNPGRNQGSKGLVIKVNYSTGRATVETLKGKVSRIFKNLKRN